MIDDKIKEYNELDKKINTIELLYEVILAYNNRKHRMINMSPFEAMKITDEEKIKEINEIKKKEYEKINEKKNILDIGEYILINPKFKKVGKNDLTYDQIKKNKLKFRIAAKIIDNKGNNYKCEFYQNYHEGEIKKGDIKYVENRLIHKCEKEEWEYFVNNHINADENIKENIKKINQKLKLVIRKKEHLKK